MKLSDVFVAAALAVQCRAAPVADPVCIVGAGPAGLTVANRLEAQGRQTVIFESQPEVGGKCQAFYEYHAPLSTIPSTKLTSSSNHFHPLGALLFTNATYREALKVINKVGVPAVPFRDGMPRWAYDAASGAVQAVPAVSALSKAVLAEEVARYSIFWAAEFAPRYAAVGYPNGVPPEFTVSTADWLARHHYRALPVLFNQGMVAYGYGDLRETPIVRCPVFWMRPRTGQLTGDPAVHAPILHAGRRAGLRQRRARLPDRSALTQSALAAQLTLSDFHEVFVRYAQSSVRGPIHLNSPVTSIGPPPPPPPPPLPTNH